MEKALVLIRKNFLTIEWVKIQCEIKLTYLDTYNGSCLVENFQMGPSIPNIYLAKEFAND